MKNKINKNIIISFLRRNQKEIEKFGIKRIGLFGSYVRGEEKNDSDIDLLIEFYQGEKTFDRFMELAFFLEDALKHRVELITMESMSPYIAPHIIKEVEYAFITS
jgi:predicted nucleotidyltransferase